LKHQSAKLMGANRPIGAGEPILAHEVFHSRSLPNRLRTSLRSDLRRSHAARSISLLRPRHSEPALSHLAPPRPPPPGALQGRAPLPRSGSRGARTKIAPFCRAVGLPANS
jgi:hypothetical protein